MSSSNWSHVHRCSAGHPIFPSLSNSYNRLSCMKPNSLAGECVSIPLSRTIKSRSKKQLNSQGFFFLPPFIHRLCRHHLNASAVSGTEIFVSNLHLELFRFYLRHIRLVVEVCVLLTPNVLAMVSWPVETIFRTRKNRCIQLSVSQGGFSLAKNRPMSTCSFCSLATRIALSSRQSWYRETAP